MSKMTTGTFDPKPAVDLWMQTADRRLNQKRSRPTSAKTTFEIEDSASSESEEKEEGL